EDGPGGGDRQAGAAIFLGAQRGKVARPGQRVDELVRVPRGGVQARPVGVVEGLADLRDPRADTGPRRVHAHRQAGGIPPAALDAGTNPLGRPARSTCPYCGSSGRAVSTIERTARSPSRSIPVRSPSDSSRNTRSSSTMLPVAPGANGQPPSPAMEASKRLAPASSAASALASPRPLVSWKCVQTGTSPAI